MPLALVAVVGGDLEFEDLFTTKDLRTSGDPAERAAGDGADAKTKDKEAQTAADEGLKGARPEKLDEASALHPRDPRYKFLKAVLLYELGDDDGSLDAFDEGKGLIEANAPPNTPPKEIARLTQEAYLQAFDHILRIERARPNPIQSNIRRLEQKFCALHGYYLANVDASRSTVFYDLALSSTANCA